MYARQQMNYVYVYMIIITIVVAVGVVIAIVVVVNKLYVIVCSIHLLAETVDGYRKFPDNQTRGSRTKNRRARRPPILLRNVDTWRVARIYR
jgi:hypothetical protein